MPDPTDETGPVTPEETPQAGAEATEKPTAASGAGPQVTAPMDAAAGQYGYTYATTRPTPPAVQSSGLRKHWPLIVAAVAAGMFLLVGGVALGSTVDGPGGWFGDDMGRGHMRGGSFDDDGGQYGQRGGMMGPNAGREQGYGQGGYGCPGDADDCPRADGDEGYGPRYGQPDGSDPSQQVPCPRATPGQSTAPQSF